jgi:hypothetical protein
VTEKRRWQKIFEEPVKASFDQASFAACRVTAQSGKAAARFYAGDGVA